MNTSLWLAEFGERLRLTDPQWENSGILYSRHSTTYRRIHGVRSRLKASQSDSATEIGNEKETGVDKMPT